MEYGSWLSVYLDFLFLLCICPFKFKNGDEQREPDIFHFKPQMAVCITTAVLDICGAFLKIRLILEYHLDNPVAYFRFMWTITSFTMHLLFYRMLWTKHKHFRKVAGILRSLSNSNLELSASKTPPYSIRLLAVLFCSLNLTLSILPAIRGTGIIPFSTNWSPKSLFQSHIEFGKYALFMKKSSLIELDHFDTSDIASSDIFIGIFHILIHTVRYIGAYFIDLGVMFAVLTVWMPVNSFLKEIQASSAGDLKRASTTMTPLSEAEFFSVDFGNSGDDKEENFNRILSKYLKLRELSDEINAAMGAVVFCYVLEGTLYYATNLNVIFQTSEWHAQLTVAHFFLGCVATFYFSADICKKIDNFRLWLCKKQSNNVFPTEKFNLLLHELELQPIGISGGDGIFTIDYALIFNIVSTTVAYFLIVVELTRTPFGD